jgi:sporulation protein YlmC with PRC-barrel domain
MRIVRDVLDKKLIDSANCEMGRVDGITLELREGEAPRLVSLEMGGEILAARVARWVTAPTKWVADRLGPRRGVVRIDWAHVKRMGRDLHLDIAAADTQALAWEHWLIDKLIGRIPGSGA